MKRVIITCDVCGVKTPYETPFSFEGLYTPTLHGLLFNRIDNCCGKCRTRLIKELRDKFDEIVNDIKGHEL